MERRTIVWHNFQVSKLVKPNSVDSQRSEASIWVNFWRFITFIFTKGKVNKLEMMKKKKKRKESEPTVIYHHQILEFVKIKFLLFFVKNFLRNLVPEFDSLFLLVPKLFLQIAKLVRNMVFCKVLIKENFFC